MLLWALDEDRHAALWRPDFRESGGLAAHAMRALTLRREGDNALIAGIVVVFQGRRRNGPWKITRTVSWYRLPDRPAAQAAASAALAASVLCQTGLPAPNDADIAALEAWSPRRDPEYPANCLPPSEV